MHTQNSVCMPEKAPQREPYGREVDMVQLERKPAAAGARTQWVQQSMDGKALLRSKNHTTLYSCAGNRQAQRRSEVCLGGCKALK